jgi:hypothetical protein
MNVKLRAIVSVAFLLLGVLLMVLAGSRMFAEGVRADATGTAGVIEPLDFVFAIGGLCAFLAGVLMLGYAVIALHRMRV